MGSMEKAAGLLLIIVGLLIFLYALPSVSTVFNTGANTSFENLTLQQKQVINVNSYVLLFLPILIIVVGGALIFKG